MKITVTFFLVFFVTFSIPGQVINDSGNHGLMLITTKKNPRLNSVEGSQYLTEDFHYGVVAIEGKQPLKVFLRYNVHQDQMEIKTDLHSEDLYVLPKKKGTMYQMGKQNFVLDEVVHNGKRISGYFVQHYNGENFRLLEKHTATVTEPVKAKTGYDQDQPARIKIEEEFYIINDKGEVRNVQVKHRDIKKTFNSSEAKKYLSENKIRSTKDLVDFIAYLDQE